MKRQRFMIHSGYIYFYEEGGTWIYPLVPNGWRRFIANSWYADIHVDQL